MCKNHRFPKHKINTKKYQICVSKSHIDRNQLSNHLIITLCKQKGDTKSPATCAKNNFFFFFFRINHHYQPQLVVMGEHTLMSTETYQLKTYLTHTAHASGGIIWWALGKELSWFMDGPTQQPHVNHCLNILPTVISSLTLLLLFSYLFS